MVPVSLRNVRLSNILLLLMYSLGIAVLVYTFQRKSVVFSNISDKELIDGLRAHKKEYYKQNAIDYNDYQPSDDDKKFSDGKDEEYVNSQKPCLDNEPIVACKPGVDTSCAPPFRQFINKYRFSKVHHISACVIEKSMSTFLAAIMCFLYDSEKFLEAGRTLGSEVYERRFCKGKNEKDFLTDIHKLDRNSSWIHIAIVREPTDRFLSGFVDKCVKERKFGDSRCSGCKGDLSCFVRAQYQRILDYATGRRLAIGYDDVHFSPQSWRCQFREALDKYYIIPYGASGDELEVMTDRLLKVLKVADVKSSERSWIRNQMLTNRTRHTTVHSPERLRYTKELYSNKDLLTMIVKMYYYDFVLFGFPFPQLIEDEEQT